MFFFYCCLKLQAYEVCLGTAKNTRTIINLGVDGVEMRGQETPDIISPDTMRPFWVAWAEGEKHNVPMYDRGICRVQIGALVPTM